MLTDEGKCQLEEPRIARSGGVAAVLERRHARRNPSEQLVRCWHELVALGKDDEHGSRDVTDGRQIAGPSAAFEEGRERRRVVAGAFRVPADAPSERTGSG